MSAAHDIHHSVFDRLLDGEAGAGRPTGPSLAALRRNVRRDLETLLNTRRRFLSVPRGLTAVADSMVVYGIPDFSSVNLGSPREQERLRGEIEKAVRRFEPRLERVRVGLQPARDGGSRVLRLRIEAFLKVGPATEPISFDSVIDPTSRNVSVTVDG
ncbi:MAG: type VI secretion system baseplate subunit TssE [Alphaproteobacteria bacterium]|nr:type VI secretion system baseplate subunit TssE [Alphaproteobacteria bacterium]